MIKYSNMHDELVGNQENWPLAIDKMHDDRHWQRACRLGWDTSKLTIGKMHDDLNGVHRHIFRMSNLTAKIRKFNLCPFLNSNFHQIKVVSRCRDTQLQVGKNYSDSIKLETKQLQISIPNNNDLIG